VNANNAFLILQQTTTTTILPIYEQQSYYYICVCKTTFKSVFCSHFNECISVSSVTVYILRKNEK